MKGVCIDLDHSDLLKQGVEYFLFPAPPNHYYVSKFNRKGAHFGCYPAERFQVTEKEVWTPEPPMSAPQLDGNLFYRARLIWRTKGYKNKPLKDYIIQPRGKYCYFWHDRIREKFCGCFPIHWFTNFEVISENQEEPKKEMKEELIVFRERPDGQLVLF
ncbi:hypothetical protein [Bacillus wiedmannii]|uniref:hypothetical protein n=1 Tax=Bacillus wiedmannii TaxID=1890302 RepID=UPI000CD92299|nr:hypothetical protein [Bacillus wiedmannii]MBG9830802.1 hypothetical protein [Bacillus wiedmannii]